MKLTRAIADRFWSKVAVGGPEDCWEWQGAKAYDGYGRFHIQGKTYLAHRVACALWAGREPRETMRHRCGNSACCNPRHLLADGPLTLVAARRGVLPPLKRGERHPQAKLPDKEIRRIRERYAAGEASQVELAGEYGARQEWIGQVVRGEVRVSAGGPITLRGKGKRPMGRAA